MRTSLLLLSLAAFATTAAAQACIDSTLIDPTAACPMIWDPVCGCNGVTYGNACEAEVFGGVTSFTPGECSGSSVDCIDLSGIDFGDCEMAMGVGIVDGNCTGLSGCGWVVNGVDYSLYSFESTADCIAACGGGTCQDLGGVDFGVCDMVMGVALVNGSCVGLSGCGWVVNGVDYSVYSFDTLEDCQADCGSGNCIDPSLADPLVDCNPFDAEPVCGCDSLTHVNPCTATYLDWVSEFTPGPCAGDCYDEARVMPEMACDDAEESVCGCDGVTYTNPCQAWYYGGLATWTAGPCATNVAEASGQMTWSVQRLDGGQIQLLGWTTDATWRAFNTAGQLIATGRNRRIDAAGWHGLIVIAGPMGSQRVLLP